MADRGDKWAGADDYEVMAAIAQSDESALAAMYDRYAALVMGLCFRVLHDRMSAEEVLEDVFFEIWKRADRYEPGRACPRTYVLTLARSRAIDRLRAQGGARQVQAKARVEVMDAAVSDGPVDAALRDEQAGQVRAALERMNPQQRRAVEMAYFGGLSHREIAEQLGEPLGTIKSRIRQGLIHLRDMLRTPDRGDPVP